MKTEADDVNCVGYAYYRLGLQDKDQWLWPENFREIKENFDEVPKEEADAIAVVIHDRHPLLVHLAALDPNDKNYVIHRRASGAKITRQSLIDIYSFYCYQDFRFKFLKLKLKYSNTIFLTPP